MRQGRDPSIDAVRGLSVVLMLGANLAPYAAPEPHPSFYRVLSTFCAPCFVFLAGAMLGRKVDPWSRVLRRSAWLLMLAALLDVGAWGVRPFLGFDVLYAIAFSLVGVRAVLFLSARHLAFLALAWCLATPLLVARFGYRPEHPVLAPPVQALLFDGWFPLFPWMGVLALGAAYLRGRAEGMSEARGIGLGVLSAIACAALWAADETEFLARGGYAELFYPPTFGVIGVFLGSLPGLLWLARRSTLAPVRRFLEPFGRRSLFVYALHLLLIGRVIAPLSRPPSWVEWSVAFVGLLVVSFTLALALDRWRFVPRSEPLRLVLGAPPESPERTDRASADGLRRKVD